MGGVTATAGGVVVATIAGFGGGGLETATMAFGGFEGAVRTAGGAEVMTMGGRGGGLDRTIAGAGRLVLAGPTTLVAVMAVPVAGGVLVGMGGGSARTSPSFTSMSCTTWRTASDSGPAGWRTRKSR